MDNTAVGLVVSVHHREASVRGSSHDECVPAKRSDGGISTALEEEREGVRRVDGDSHHQRRYPKRVALLETARVCVEERENVAVVRVDGAVEGVVSLMSTVARACGKASTRRWTSGRLPIAAG